MKYACAVCFVVGFSTGIVAMYEAMKVSAIAHHAAHHDATSWKFTWNDEQVAK